MPEYEKDRRSAWADMKSSQGKLREGEAKKKKDGQDHQTGYRPHEQEKNRPREAARLENTFGDISVGTTKKKEVTMVVSRRRNEKGPAVEEDEKYVQGDSAVLTGKTQAKFQVSGRFDQKTAVVHRMPDKKAPQIMINRFRALMKHEDRSTLRNQAPFLDREEEKSEMKQLRERELALRAGGESDAREELRAIERRRQQLQQTIAEKEGEERRLRLVLQKAQEESRQRSEDTWERPFAVFDQTGGLDEPDGGGEEEQSEQAEQPADEENGTKVQE